MLKCLYNYQRHLTISTNVFGSKTKPIHDELASRRPASDSRQGSGCGGMTLQNHASNPPAAAQWKQDACNLYLEPRPPMARPRVPSLWPPQSNACNDPDGNRTLALLSYPEPRPPVAGRGNPPWQRPSQARPEAARSKSTPMAVVTKQTSIA